MNTSQAKKIPIKEYLAASGHYPVSRKALLYHAPYRRDRNPSFIVNAEKNLWYDYAWGEGGNIIDLVMLIEKQDVKGSLKHLSEFSQGNTPNDDSFFSFSSSFLSEENIYDLKNTALLDYLKNRCISEILAKIYLKEAYYKVSGKRYFAIAFRNQKGGYELRNKYWKGSSAPKYYSFIRGQRKGKMNVFEGFMDFLSALEYYGMKRPSFDTVVLNSTANVGQYDFSGKKINAFLDRDHAGRNALASLQENAAMVVDRSIIYEGYKDFNEYVVKWKTSEKS